VPPLGACGGVKCGSDGGVRHLPDGSRWSATILTLAEVDRLMSRWARTGESVGGNYFRCFNGLTVHNASA
jgi:hypothetical protein